MNGIFESLLLAILFVLISASVALGSPLDIRESFNTSLDSIREPISELSQLADDGTITVAGVTYRIDENEQGESIAATSRSGNRDLVIPIGQKAKAINILMFGTDLVRKVSGFRPPSGISDFHIEIYYSNGLVDVAFPFNPARGDFVFDKGLSSYVVYTSMSDVAVDRIRMVNKDPQNVFCVLAVDLQDVSSTEQIETLYKPLTWESPKTDLPNEVSPTLSVENGIISVENSYYAVQIDTGSGVRLAKFINKLIGVPVIREDRVSDLFALDVDGRNIRSREFHVLSITEMEQNERKGLRMVLASQSQEVHAEFEVWFDVGPEIDMSLTIKNVSERSLKLIPEAPSLLYMRIGENAENDLYFFPRKGGLISYTSVSLPHDVWTLYGQNVSTPFVSLADSDCDGGLYVIVKDTENEPKYFGFSKLHHATLQVRYAYLRILNPGESWALAPWSIGVNKGDWRTGFERYKDWLQTWYKRYTFAGWILDLFNLRNAFSRHHAIGTQLRNKGAEMDAFIEEGEERFGGYDYIHWQDWWDNVGDYDVSPELAQAVRIAKDHGIPIGLYMEGFLFAKNGNIVKTHGTAWEMRRADGGVYDHWPSHFACLSLEEWKSHLVDSAVRLVSELPIDGIYIDEFGFGVTNFCYRSEHNHPIPNRPLDEQVDILQRVRAALDSVRPGIALYIESPANDYVSQFVDAVFGYNVSLDIEQVPPYEPSYIDIYRFAFPEVKVFSIASGQFDEYLPGLKRAFFNGTGIWYAELNRRMSEEGAGFIAKSTAVMRENRDALNGNKLQPLLPTMHPMILVNLFSGDDKQLYTFYNRGQVTYRGTALRIPYAEGTKFIDVWNECPAKVRVDGDSFLLDVDLYPEDVGAVVAVKPRISWQILSDMLVVEVPKEAVGSVLEVKQNDRILQRSEIGADCKVMVDIGELSNTLTLKLLKGGVLQDMAWVDL